MITFSYKKSFYKAAVIISNPLKISYRKPSYETEYYEKYPNILVGSIRTRGDGYCFFCTSVPVDQMMKVALRMLQQSNHEKQIKGDII